MKRIIVSFYICFLISNASAQSFTPVALSGFNQDVVAETGTSSLTTTTLALDGITVSDKVMYTLSFRTNVGFGGGGIPDNGTIVDAAGTYQMQAFNGNNALIVQRNQNADLNLVTPASFNVIRILCFSTEGPSLINATLFFTDGSSTNAITGYSLGDWFNNNANLVLSGFGRCTRATPASGADAYSLNPRLYYIEIPLSCADRHKSLQKINFANVTTAGTNAPYPNAVFFALSGKSYSQTITPSITNAACDSTGAATLNISGSSASYNVLWNTSPAQFGPTATNLLPGSYTATITDLNSCVTSYPVIIGLDTNITMDLKIDTTICLNASFIPNLVSNALSYSWSPTIGVSDSLLANPILSPTTQTAYTVTGTLGPCTISKTITVYVTAVNISSRLDTTICFGDSFIPNLVSNGTAYSWSPSTGVSNISILNPSLSPTSTSYYSVRGTLDGCASVRTFLVNVTVLTMTSHDDTTICLGTSFNPNIISNASAYSWSPTIGVSNSSITNPNLSPSSFTNYTITGTTGACSVSRSFNVNLYPPVNVNAGNTVSIFGGQSVILNGSGSSGTYSWSPATSLSTTSILHPIATPPVTTIYTLTITTSVGCSNSDAVTINVVPYCVKPLNAFTPNEDGYNDKWLVTDGNCTEKIEVSVYNRYGSKVYESKDYHNDWDGTYRGKPLPDATYYYVLKFYLLSGKVEFKKGDVTILR